MDAEGRDGIVDAQTMLLRRVQRIVDTYYSFDPRNGEASRDLMQHMAVLLIGAAACDYIIDRWDAQHGDNDAQQ